MLTKSENQFSPSGADSHPQPCRVLCLRIQSNRKIAFIVWKASFPLSQLTDPACPQSELPKQAQTEGAHGEQDLLSLAAQTGAELHLTQT